jgi:hypothetical protein
MKSVVLYFPYAICLKVFLLEEKLKDVTLQPGDLFLATMLNQQQIDKACVEYGAIIQ